MAVLVWPAWAERALIILFGSLIFWIASGVTLDATVGSKVPTLVERVWPIGNAAKIARVIDLLRSSSPSVIAVREGRDLMRNAILREPVNSAAVANLAGLTELAGDKSRARSLFRLSETLSRRNLLVQTWLIEDAARRGHIGDAINHYNRALNVSEELRPQLLPILVAATDDPEIRNSLAPVLAKRPSWWTDYMVELGSNGKSLEALDMSARAVRLDIRRVEERGLAELVLKKMVELKAFRRSIGLVEALDGRRSQVRTLQGGDFETSESVAPFGWWLRDDGEVRAFRETVPATGRGLWLEASADASGGVAQQLIGLSAGVHIMSGLVGDVPTDKGSGGEIQLACAEGGEAFARFSLPEAGAQGRRFQFRFTVPSTGCEAQWVNILVSSVSTDTRIWLDRLTVTG